MNALLMGACHRGVIEYISARTTVQCRAATARRRAVTMLLQHGAVRLPGYCSAICGGAHDGPGAIYSVLLEHDLGI
jgi:hypothetical protein